VREAARLARVACQRAVSDGKVVYDLRRNFIMKHLTSTLLAAIAIVAAGSSSAQSSSTRAVGPVTAAVRIDVFSDYECPACKQLHEQTLKRIKEEYALKGRLRLVHHDFPLPQHKHARRAAALAAAADRLGKFDEVSDALFRQQVTWSKTGGVDEVVDSVLTPEEQKRIDQLAADPAIAASIERDIQLGQRMKVSSTPTMIVTHNGKPNPVVGVITYPVFSRFLNSLLGSAQ
jgi:protein-disulfide isomerase